MKKRKKYMKGQLNQFYIFQTKLKWLIKLKKEKLKMKGKRL